MMSFTQRFGCFAGFAALLALVTGCASPGPPRAPSLHLPTRVSHLTAERRGDSVVLRFATPERTTDNGPLTGPVSASLCRAAGEGICRPTSNFPGKTTVAGPVEWVDALPPELAAGAASRIVYRVELFNANGRSAGPSEPAFVAAGDAPHRVEDLRAEGSREGIVLHWTPEVQATGEVLVKREALDAAGSAPQTAAPGKKAGGAAKNVGGRKGHDAKTKPGIGAAEDEDMLWMHAESSSGRDSGGMIDATAGVDKAYRYTAVRNRDVTVDGRGLELRSEPSAAVTITLRDVFPPGIPQGLLVAEFPVQGSDGIAVDLVWRPNTEGDLAGYNVYRQVPGADGAAVKLNEKLVTLPAFHDASAVRGVGYRYTVTAVDAKGNESAASEPATLAATP